MEILEGAADHIDVRFDRPEAMALYRVLVEVEAWPSPALGPRPHIRQVREVLGGALGMTDGDGR